MIRSANWPTPWMDKEMSLFQSMTFGRFSQVHKNKKFKKDSNLVVDPLDDRVMPVVAAFNVPSPLRPNKSNAGVVLIRQSTDDVGGATGTLLDGAQYVLTAAHVVDSNGDHVADQPYYYVNYDLPAGRVQMVVPGNRVKINPQWQGSTDAGFQNGHDQAILQLPALSPWGSGPGSLGYSLYTGGGMTPGSSSSSNKVNIVGYGYSGDGTTGQNTSPNPSQVSSTVQRLMLPPTAQGPFTLRNPKTRSSINLNAKGLTSSVVQKAVQSLDPTGFIDVQVVQITQKASPYFGSFDIVFRQVDTSRYPIGNVPALQMSRQLGFSGGSQGPNYRTGIARPAFPTMLGSKSNASTRFNSNPSGMDNVFVTQLSPNRGLALLGQGDSGGPALLRRQIVGVASFYSGASQFGDVSGWSSVNPDLAWIQTNSKVGGNVVVDLATQPVTKGKPVDYVSVRGDRKTDSMVILVHGRQIFSAQMSSISSVQIVPRGAPAQFRTIGRPSFTVTNVQNNQRGYLGRVERVSIMGETPSSPAVVMAAKLPTIQSASKTSPITNIVNDVKNQIDTGMNNLSADWNKLRRSTTNTISDALHDGLQSELNKARQGIQQRIRKVF